jgi:hypothetical protein
VRFPLVGVLLCFTIPLPAWAEGAFAVGCLPNGGLVWGWQFGESNIEVAKEKTLQHCAEQGSECELWRKPLAGDGPWFAFAYDEYTPSAHCMPFGWAYSWSQERAESEATAECQKDGGQYCAVRFLKQNAGRATDALPAMSGGLPSDRCWYDPHKAWRPYGVIACR